MKFTAEQGGNRFDILRDGVLEAYQAQLTQFRRDIHQYLWLCVVHDAIYQKFAVQVMDALGPQLWVPDTRRYLRVPVGDSLFYVLVLCYGGGALPSGYMLRNAAEVRVPIGEHTAGISLPQPRVEDQERSS